MASLCGPRLGFLGLGLWLLLLLPQLSEAPAGGDGAQGRGALPPAPPTPSGGGREVPESSAVPESHATAVPRDLVAFRPSGSDSYRILTGQKVSRGKAYRTGAEAKTTRQSPFTAGCGHRMRIVGGVPASVKKWPWQVSLQINDEHVCGGSLIARQWVLTAAHCIQGHMEYNVKMGDINVRHTSRMAVVVPVQDVVIHRYYDAVLTIEHDIALVFLQFPVNYSTHIQPVCLPESAFVVQADKECWVSGWGRLSEKDPRNKYPIFLQEAELSIIRHQKCSEILKQKLKTVYTMARKGTICGYNTKGKDTCQGDSGGPLVCEYNNTWIQVGIVSWGIGCGRKGYPGIYMEVSFYGNWVKSQMNQASSQESAGFLILSLCLVLPFGILMILESPGFLSSCV